FVFDFLGSVNSMAGKVKRGMLETGSYKIELPEYSGLDDSEGIGYVRPHDLDIDKDRLSENSIESIVEHIHPIGSVVRIELIRRDNGEMIEAEIPKNLFQSMSIQIGERVFVTPRSVKMFLDYSI
ncbi:TOBE-like domain-containing protein, partial [Pradoshia sp.]